VEARSFVAKTLLASAKGTEVLRRLRDNIPEQLKLDASSGLPSDLHVKEYLRVGGSQRRLMEASAEPSTREAGGLEERFGSGGEHEGEKEQIMQEHGEEIVNNTTHSICSGRPKRHVTHFLAKKSVLGLRNSEFLP
jgi:hypothetical protein